MMGRNPDLSKLEGMFRKGESFELTDAQYERKTGAPLPKDKSYLINRSALARYAKEKGYEIKVVEKRVILHKH